MRLAVPQFCSRLLVLCCAVVALVACGSGGGSKPGSVRPDNVPASFDVTLVAGKDDQFDYMEAPLTAQDLRGALNYRKEQGQPMATVLLKRGEKQKVKDSHVVALARIAVALKFQAFIEEKDGSISAIQTTSTTSE